MVYEVYRYGNEVKGDEPYRKGTDQMDGFWMDKSLFRFPMEVILQRGRTTISTGRDYLYVCEGSSGR